MTTFDTIDLALTNVIGRSYRVHRPVLYLLADSPEKRIYRIDQDGHPTFVLRLYATETVRYTAFDHAGVLLFLEHHSYPAERVVRATDGSPVVRLDDRQILVTRFIPGLPASFSLRDVSLMGVGLGRLHALDASGKTGVAALLPRAGMLSANELDWATMRLALAEPRVPPNLRQHYEMLVSAVRQVDRCEGLPSVLIHNDYHPGNVVATLDGEIVVFDWEGAGRGPAVIDIGFLLSSCTIPYLSTTPLGPDDGLIASIVDGYCRNHQLSRPELQRLPDAIRFRAIVTGVGSLVTALTTGEAEEGSSWWWNRFVAAEEIADRALPHFHT